MDGECQACLHEVYNRLANCQGMGHDVLFNNDPDSSPDLEQFSAGICRRCGLVVDTAANVVLPDLEVEAFTDETDYGQNGGGL
jgi:hypothetical protein